MVLEPKIRSATTCFWICQSLLLSNAGASQRAECAKLAFHPRISNCGSDTLTLKIGITNIAREKLFIFPSQVKPPCINERIIFPARDDSGWARSMSVAAGITMDRVALCESGSKWKVGLNKNGHFEKEIAMTISLKELNAMIAESDTARTQMKTWKDFARQGFEVRIDGKLSVMKKSGGIEIVDVNEKVRLDCGE